MLGLPILDKLVEISAVYITREALHIAGQLKWTPHISKEN